MSRLTYKLDEPIKTKYLNFEYKRIADYDIDKGNFGRITDDKIYNKLGELEDIEEELGCPLEVREKTLNSFYCPKFENDKKLLNYYVYAFNNEELFIRLIYSQYDEYYNEEITILLKDYKKTWALCEEDLKSE